ncbi:hypothetical protein MMC30_000611 [Trapelia coarctata]|nr:hypothetical protein [Trapelia coarctata]
MSSIRSAASAALLLLTLSWRADAQSTNSSCINTDFLSPNATGSLTVAGFQPPELGTNSTFTLSTAVTSKSNPQTSPPTAQMLQTFFLTTTPFVDLSAPNIPLTGCVIALSESGNPSSTGTGQNGCQGVLASACQQAIVEQVNNQSLANSGSGPSTNASCEIFLQVVPQECRNAGNAWSILGVSDSLGNPPSGGPSCPSLGAGTPSTSPALLTSSAPFTPSSSNSTYDTWLKQATPVILTAWLKNGSGSSAWADTRVVCLSAGNVAAGSRVPSAAGRSTSRATGSVILGMVGAVAWGLL